MKTQYPLLFLPLLCACSDYSLDFNPEKLSYDAAFEQTFGQLDPAHDFTLAQRCSVSVTPGACHTISIYSDAQSGHWQLIGQYSHIAQPTDLEFDAVRTAGQFLVTDGFHSAMVASGASVDFSATTRTSPSGTAEGPEVTDGAGTEQLIQSDLYASARVVRNWLNDDYPYFYFSPKTLQSDDPAHPSVLDKMPALSSPATDADRGNLDQEDVIYDFTYRSRGQFILYPVYWRTPKVNTVGIYYQDPETTELVRIPLLGNGAYNESLQWVTDADYPFWSTCRLTSDRGTLGEPKYADANILTHRHWRSKGIVVDIPVGTLFGFYMINDEGYVHYTDASRNNVVQWSRGKEQACYFANFVANGYQWLCMEDVHDVSGTHSDYDFDDIVCLFGGNEPAVVEHETPGWLLAFEDLGDTFDWDYNDVILQFNYVSGQSQATIIPIAAGGTLPSVIHFNDGTADQTVGEVHRLLNPSLAESAIYQPINASSRGKSGEAVTVTITNPSTFSITQANAGMGSNDPTAAVSAIGVSIVVNGQTETNYIAYQGAGHAPQVLILPKSYTLTEGTQTFAYRWAWPTEVKHIYESYATADKAQFNAWIADHTQAQDWYKYPTENVVEEQRWLVADATGSITQGDATHQSEYYWPNYGTMVTIPVPDDTYNYLYRFDPLQLLTADQPAVLTLAAKGGLKISDGEHEYSLESNYGKWTAMPEVDDPASTTVPFTEAKLKRLNQYDADVEVMCQISLTAAEVNTIRSNSQLMIWAGLKLLALSVKQ